MQKVSSITLSWISARAGNGLRLVEPGIFVGQGRRDNLVPARQPGTREACSVPTDICVGSPVPRELASGNLVANWGRKYEAGLTRLNFLEGNPPPQDGPGRHPASLSTGLLPCDLPESVSPSPKLAHPLHTNTKLGLGN